GIRDRNVTGVQTCALPISAVWEPFDPRVDPRGGRPAARAGRMRDTGPRAAGGATPGADRATRRRHAGTRPPKSWLLSPVGTLPRDRKSVVEGKSVERRGGA